MTTRASVALIRTTPETVLQDYQRLMELAGFRRHLDRAAATILKDSVLWHFPFPAANTAPWQLEGVARALKQAGYHNLVCVQSKTIVNSAFKGKDLNGYLPILRAYEIPALRNDKPEDMRWVRFEPKGQLLVLDRMFDHDIRIPDCYFGKNMVHLPTVKCDRRTIASGAMQNAYGGLLKARRHDMWNCIHEVLVDLLTIQQEIHSGIFAVMDGTVAGNGRSRPLRPELKNVILASADQVAIDAVAAKLMGFDPLHDLPYVCLAHERGLGVGDPREIELAGDTDLANENWRFSLDRIRWLDPLKPLLGFFMLPPLARLFAFGVESYRDYYRWPAKDRQTFESWLRATGWGQLFQRYQKQGHLGAVPIEARILSNNRTETAQR